MLRHGQSRYVRSSRRLKRRARRCRNAEAFLHIRSSRNFRYIIYLELYPSPESGLVQPFSGERYRVTKENLYLSVLVLFILGASFAPRDGSESDDVYDDTDYCHYTHHSEQCLEHEFVSVQGTGCLLIEHLSLHLPAFFHLLRGKTKYGIK